MPPSSQEVMEEIKHLMAQAHAAEQRKQHTERVSIEQDSIMRAFEVAFEHAIRQVVQQKLNEKMAEIEVYFNSIDLQKVIADTLATEFTRQFIAGRLLHGSGSNKPAMPGGVASGQNPVGGYTQAAQVLKKP